MAFIEIDPKQIPENAFQLIGTDWMLITAGDAQKCNTMTASWGGVGVLSAPRAVAAGVSSQSETPRGIF